MGLKPKRYVMRPSVLGRRLGNLLNTPEMRETVGLLFMARTKQSGLETSERVHCETAAVALNQILGWCGPEDPE